MVGFAWEGLREEPALLKGIIGRANGACVGVYAEVVEPGGARLDDPVTLT